MTDVKPVKVLVLVDGHRYKRGVLVKQVGDNLYKIKLLEGAPETYRGEPMFITELTLHAEDFIIIEGLGEVLYE